MTGSWSALLCRAAHAGWSAWCGPRARRFHRALRDPESAQRLILERILRRNRESDYGRHHGFGSIDGVEEYRRRVPLVTWDALEPWIRRVRDGERQVLTKEPVRRLVPTGGSTSGRKLVPWTAAFAGEWSRAVHPWIHHLLARHPGVRGGPAYWSVSPALDAFEEAPAAVPVGFEEDSAYLGGLLGPLVRATLAVPEEIRRVREVEAFRYLTVLALLRAEGLRLISVWHPSFFGLLLDAMERHWPRLLRDVARGTTTPAPSPSSLLRRAGPDPRRARALERAGPGAPHLIWPRLALLSCWADGPSAGPARALRARLPGVACQPKGLLATEGVVTVPFGGARPAAVRSHFLEFLDGGGRARTVGELREGETYEPVLTTGAGLYRYRLGDRVRVEGFLESTPCLGFVGRADRISDLRGEKLDGAFVSRVLEDLFGGRSPAFAMLAPDPRAGTPRYTLYVEGGERLPPGLGERLDAALSANPHYRYCRRLGQLGPPGVFRVTGGADAVHLAREGGRGRRTGDVKPQALSDRSDWSRHLRGTYQS